MQKTSPLFFFPSDHLYLFAHKFNYRTQYESFESKVETFLKKKLCKNLLSIYLNKSGLFFTQEPTNENEFFKFLVGVIYIEYLHIHSLCANNAGRRILHEYVFPRIPEEDFNSKITLDPIYTAIVFYLKIGFKFEDTRIQRKFDKLLQKYPPEEITETIKDIVKAKKKPHIINRDYYDKLADLIHYMDTDDEVILEMYWMRKK
jgi:hypothetical protein